MNDLRKALAQTEKPPVKSYCGGKPNYCTPEGTPAVTGKAFALDRGCWERGCVAYDERDGDGVNISAERVDETAKCKREWVGLTEEEAIDLLPVGDWEIEPTLVFAKAIEAALKEKNA